MTLDTRVIVRDGIAARRVFDFCRTLLSPDPSVRWTQLSAWRNPGWMNEPSQGLDGWLMVFFGPDGPLQRDCDCDFLGVEDSKPCGGCRTPVGFVEVSIDTAYSWSGPAGMTCGDLHAGFVDKLGHWLDEQGKRWSWFNEFTGEWHDGREGLDELGDAATAAVHWFDTKVLPAIATEMGQR